VRKLLAIKQSLNDKRERLRELIEQIQNADPVEKEKFQKQIAGLRETIQQLTSSFEIIAARGARLNQQVDPNEQPLDWRDELMQIARPLLSGLQEATEKPRRIEALRREINLYQQRLEVAQNAAESIAASIVKPSRCWLPPVWMKLPRHGASAAKTFNIRWSSPARS
jgi:chromosome segregation ATPase